MKLDKIIKFFKVFKFIYLNPIQAFKRLFIQTKDDYYKSELLKKYNLSQIPTIDINSLFPNFNETLNLYTFLPGTSTILDLVLLKQLASRFKDGCDYLEIGAWRGESAFNMQSLCKSILMISLGEDEMKLKGFSSKFIEQNELFTRNNDSFNVIHADTQKFNFDQITNKFDLIFIDGDHQFNSIVSDTKNIFGLLKNSSSIIVWHDYGFDPEYVRHETLAAILEGVSPKCHKNIYHVSNTLSAIYMENYTGPVYYTQFPTKPKGVFQVNIKSKEWLDEFRN